MIQKCVGISFNPTKDETIIKGSKVQLVHDTNNQYSSRAIAVKYGDRILGHIGEKGNEKHEEIFKVLPIEATVHTISTLQSGETFSSFKEGEITHLEISFPMPSDLKNGIKSFNEDVEIDFNEEKHSYTYKGKELIGGTTYIKRWIKEFDKETIAGFSAKSLGVKTQEVIDMWDSGGDVSSLWGKAIDAAITHYERFKVLGKIMQDKKGLEFNKALPSHPLLRQIVIDYYKQDLQEEGCTVLTQVLVTNVERGLSGFIDRLIIKDPVKKICRIRDYKAKIGFTDVQKNKFLGQFADLTPTKQSESQLQMSFYARLLQLSGWTVEGCVADLYEDVWKQYEMPILKLDF